MKENLPPVLRVWGIRYEPFELRERSKQVGPIAGSACVAATELAGQEGPEVVQFMVGTASRWELAVCAVLASLLTRSLPCKRRPLVILASLPAHTAVATLAGLPSRPWGDPPPPFTVLSLFVSFAGFAEIAGTRQPHQARIARRNLRDYHGSSLILAAPARIL